MNAEQVKGIVGRVSAKGFRFESEVTADGKFVIVSAILEVKDKNNEHRGLLVPDYSTVELAKATEAGIIRKVHEAAQLATIHELNEHFSVDGALYTDPHA